MFCVASGVRANFGMVPKFGSSPYRVGNFSRFFATDVGRKRVRDGERSEVVGLERDSPTRLSAATIEWQRHPGRPPTPQPHLIFIFSSPSHACKVWPYRPPPPAASDLTGVGLGGDRSTMRCVADFSWTVASLTAILSFMHTTASVLDFRQHAAEYFESEILLVT